MAHSPTLVTDALHTYMLDHSLREPDVLKRLRAKTGALEEARWQVAPEQGQFMALLAQIHGARRHLEVGTFTGYGTLWLALALPDDGEIITCEVEETFANIGRPYWQEAGVADRIDLRFGPALETLEELISAGQSGTFDMAFIDADKPPYPDYYELCMELVRPGGLVLLDNMFWDGAVIDPDDTKNSTRALRQVSDRIHSDERVFPSMVPIGDGLTIARKLP